MIFWIGFRNHPISWNPLSFNNPFLSNISIFTEVLVARYHWLSRLLSWIKTLIQAHLVNIALNVGSRTFLRVCLVYYLSGLWDLIINLIILFSWSLALASLLAVSSTVHMARDCARVNKCVRCNKGDHLIWAFLVVLVLVSLRWSFRADTDSPSLRPSLGAMALIHYYLRWL